MNGGNAEVGKDGWRQRRRIADRRRDQTPTMRLCDVPLNITRYRQHIIRVEHLRQYHARSRTDFYSDINFTQSPDDRIFDIAVAVQPNADQRPGQKLHIAVAAAVGNQIDIQPGTSCAKVEPADRPLSNRSGEKGIVVGAFVTGCIATAYANRYPVAFEYAKLGSIGLYAFGVGCLRKRGCGGQTHG